MNGGNQCQSIKTMKSRTCIAETLTENPVQSHMWAGNPHGNFVLTKITPSKGVLSYFQIIKNQPDIHG